MTSALLQKLLVELLMVYIGYRWVSKLVTIQQRRWGFFIAIAIFMFLQMTQSFIHPWPFGFPLLLTGYVALGVGAKSMYKPDLPAPDGDTASGGEPPSVSEAGKDETDEGDTSAGMDETGAGPADHDKDHADKDAEQNNQN